MIRLSLLTFLLCNCLLSAQEEEPQDDTQVSVLGYHQFHATRKNTDMRIQTGKFREQMQTLRDLNIPVISMEDFIAWKKDGKTIPSRCVMITIDDGFKSIYTDAYPILKEFGYPFTLFLYKQYVDGGSRALSSKMIREMQKNGATIGGHSYTHPLPSIVRKHRDKGPKHFSAYLNTELGESREFLSKRFKQEIQTYAYPGGYYVKEMFPLAASLGYEFLFTVSPRKVRRKTPDNLLPRYIILGTHDNYFRLATDFVGATKGGIDNSLIQKIPFPAYPGPGDIIEERTPIISLDLSRVASLDPTSLQLTIGGFGRVEHSFDSEKKVLSWKVRRPLRLSTCEVTFRYRKHGSTKYESPVRWLFQVDLEASYLPKLLK